MGMNRKEFLKVAGLAGAGAASLGTLGRRAFAGTIESDVTGLPENIETWQNNHTQRFNMSGYGAPAIDTVRVGIIGTGNRGSHHAGTLIRVSNVEIRAAADVAAERFERIRKNLEGSGHTPDYYADSEDDWKKVCERDDLDLILITTPTYLHAEMVVYAMEQGKHVITEVPAAVTVEECWDLVRTSEKTRRHCMMMENYSFMPFQITTLNMAKQGFFGEIVHGDGAYNTSKMGNNFSKTTYWNMWWLRMYGARKGNIYPTHGMGPIAQMMNINRGDRFDFLVSVESRDFMMGERARELAKEDGFYEDFTNLEYRGNMSSMLIRTKRGRTLNIQHDATSPSPHNLIHGVYGTEGAVLFDPPPPRICKGDHRWVNQETCDALVAEYKPGLLRQFEKFREGLGATLESGHGGSDLINVWHIIDCLRNSLPLDQDVYDAAAWSVITDCTEKSVANRSMTVDIPDFTRGQWQHREPLGIIEG